MRLVLSLGVLVLIPVLVMAAGSPTCPGAEVTIPFCDCGTTTGATLDHDCGTGHAGPDVVYHVTGLTVGLAYQILAEASYDADWTLAETCNASTPYILCSDYTGIQANPSCSSLVHSSYGYCNYIWTATQSEAWFWVDGYGSTNQGNYCVEILQYLTPTPSSTPTISPTPSPTATPCYTLFYENDFPTALGDITVYNCDGAGANNWAYSSSYFCGQSGGMTHSYNATTDNDWARTGVIDISNQQCVTLEFDYAHTSIYDDILTVYVSQTGASPCLSPEDWVQVWGPWSTAAVCLHASVDLCSVVPGLCCGWDTLYVAFRYEGTNDFHIDIDNVKVHDNCCGPGCEPTNTPLYSYTPTPTRTPSNTPSPSPTPAPGDSCETGLPINVPEDFPFSEVGYSCDFTNDYHSGSAGGLGCASNFGAASVDVVYILNVTAQTDVSVLVNAVDYDGSVYLVTACDGSGTCQFVQDEPEPFAFHQVLEPGIYYLIIDGYGNFSNDCGNYTLDISVYQTPTPSLTPTITATPTVTATPTPTETPCYVSFYSNEFTSSLDMTVYDCVGTGSYTWAFTNSYYCGQAGGMYHYYNSTSDDDWAVASAISIADQQCVTLEFDYTHTNYDDSLEVYVSATGASPCLTPEDWIAVAGPYLTTTTCQHVSVDLCSAVPGLCCGWDSLYVGFRYQGSDDYYIVVDNVLVHDNCCGPGCTPTATPIYSYTPTSTPSPTETPTSTPLPVCIEPWESSDSFGYSAANNASGLTSYQWFDIMTSGTKVQSFVNSSTDDGYTCVDLPFEFVFYGITYNRLYVSTNGYLTFQSDGRDFLEAQLPVATHPNAMIAGFWDDQKLFTTPPDDDAIYWEILGVEPSRLAVFTFKVHQYSATTPTYPPYLYQIILFEDTNNIKIQWNSMGTASGRDGSSASVGIENETGDFGISYFYHVVGALLDECAVEFFAPAMAPQPIAAVPVRINEVYYKGLQASEDDEYVELFNTSDVEFDIDEYLLGDEETAGDGEGMYSFPLGAQIDASGVLIIAKKATAFAAQFGYSPDYEFVESDPTVPNLIQMTSYATGTFALANDADNVVLLTPDYSAVDVVNYGPDTLANYSDCVRPHLANAIDGDSLHRCPPTLDTDDCAVDFTVLEANPGAASCAPTRTPTVTPTPTVTATPTATVTPFCTTDYYSSLPNLIIDDYGCPAFNTDTITVPNSDIITKVSVQVYILHAWVNDVNLYLLGPDGVTEVELTTGNGGSGDNYYYTVFDQAALTSITSGTPPFSGTYRPEGDLDDFVGLNSAGDWTIEVCDSAEWVDGTLVFWALCLRGQPSPTPTPVYSPTPAAIPAAYPSGLIVLVLGLSMLLGSGFIRRR